MSEGLNIGGAGNTINITLPEDSETDANTSTGDSSESSGTSEAGMELLSKFLDGAFEDGKLDDNEMKALETLADTVGGSEGSDESEGTDGTDGTDESDDSGETSELTPQDFMSELNGLADETKGLTDGEKKMLEAGKGMINATPEQQQAFLDKAKELSADGEIDDNKAAELEGFADGLMNEASDSGETSGTDSAEEKPFMDQVEDLLSQSQGGDEGPGEKMAREAAQMLEDNPEEDQQAFLDELETMLNNTDGNGDYEKDIDEKNDGEGTMLKNMAEAFEDLPSDRSDSGDSSDSGSTSSDNTAVRDFLNEVTSDGEVSDSDITALRALIDATATEESEETVSV
jgi:hypothetical protein